MARGAEHAIEGFLRATAELNLKGQIGHNTVLSQGNSPCKGPKVS